MPEGLNVLCLHLFQLTDYYSHLFHMLTLTLCFEGKIKCSVEVKCPVGTAASACRSLCSEPGRVPVRI